MQYFVRSVKYFAALCVLTVGLMALMILTNTSPLTFEETLYLMFHSDRFLLPACAILVLSASYPLFGFTVRRIEGDLVKHRTQIEHACQASGFRVVEERDGVLIVRGEGFFKRLKLLFEDEIIIRQEGREIVVDGIRRGVAMILYRLDSYIQMVNRNEH